MQLSFGEAFQKKHILIYDTDDNTKEYVENEFSPKHYIISENELEKYDLKGNFVRLEVEDMANRQISEMRQSLIENSDVSSLEIKQVQKKEDHTINDAKSILYKEEEMLEKYVDQVKPDLNKKVLIKIGSEICKKSEDS